MLNINEEIYSLGVQSVYKTIRETLDYWNNKLIELQTECKHLRTTKTAKADTGNFFKGDDEYWYDCICLDCNKHWTEPQ